MSRERWPIGLPLEEDVRRELRFHLEMRTRELEEQGLDPEEARRRAMATFGDYDEIARACRDASSPSPRDTRQMLDSILQDLRFALRSLRGSPGFVALAVLTLALGIGANTAIFSVVHEVLLQPLPYPEPDRIVAVWEAREDGSPTYPAARNYFDWRESSESFESLAMYPSYAFSAPTTVLGGELPARAWVASVGQGFFETLGVPPALGRPFRAEEHVATGASVVVVSHDFWSSMLGSETDLEAIELRAYGRALRVIGVMPPGFTYPERTDLWLPSDADQAVRASRTSHGYEVIGRLRDGVDIEQAREELTAIHDGILAIDAEDAAHPHVVVRSLHEQLYGSSRQPLLLLLGAAGLVLLVACTNLASALLARGAKRGHELAIRASLGAHRSRILRQLFTETVVIGVGGGIAGILAGGAALEALARFYPESVPRAESLGLDLPVTLSALALALATTLLFGLLPSIRLSRTGVGAALRSGSRGGSDDAGRMWSWLVGAEVALAVLLLIGSGLLVRSFQEILSNDPGFDASDVLTVELSLPGDLYPASPDIVPPLEAILEEARSLPGVSAAGAINNLPLSGASLNGGFVIEGRPEEEGGYANYRVVAGDYFEAMEIPLIRGRAFGPQDDADARHAVVINQAAADRFWPGEDPIGQRILSFSNDGWVYDQPATIVGIVGNVRHAGLTRAPSAEVYLDFRQRPMRLRGAVLTIESEGDPGSLIASLRGRVAEIDDQIPLAFTTMAARVGRSIDDRAFVMAIIGVFSLIALLLAAVGIYGVVSYSTARRTREIGIRMALGAAPESVRRLVILDALKVVGAGVLVGVIAALAGSRLLESLLYEISPTDPWTFASVVVVLLGAAWLASAIPAWRGSRVDPMITMRETG